MKPVRIAYICAAAAAMIWGLGTESASARTIQVGTCTPAALHFDTIQAAVNAAFANDTVAICPGTYPEQVVVTRNITLTNVVGMVAPTIASPSGGLVANTTSLSSGNPVAAQIVAGVSDATSLTKVNVKNLIVDGSNNQIGGCSPNLIGIYYRNAYGQIATNTVQNQRLSDSLLGCQVGLAIFVQNVLALPTPTSVVTISKNNVFGFQKNGITTNEPGSAVKITSNTVTGLGPTPAIAQNGIQVAYGATGSIASNTVSALVYTGSAAAASTGVLGYASGGLTIKSNKIASTQYGVSVDSDPSLGDADGNTIISNTVQNTDTYDGLDVCSDHNTVTKNTINSSQESGIHLDALCTGSSGTTGTDNAVSSNKINGACAGILSGQASGTNNIGTNKIVNTTYPTLFDSDVCPVDSSSMTLASQIGSKTDKTTPAGGARLVRIAHRVAKPVRL